MAYKQTPLNMGSSPLKGNYESGVDGIRYVSTAPAFQDMQNKIAGGTAKAIDGLKPKEPDTSKETNSSDYDRNSTVNNYYYGNQPQSGFGGFDDVSKSVSQIGEPLETGKTPPMSASSGGGGSERQQRTKTTLGAKVEKQATTPEEIKKYNQYLANVKSGKVKRNTKYDSTSKDQERNRLLSQEWGDKGTEWMDM